jgi:predicted HTH domain antitoxin
MAVVIPDDVLQDMGMTEADLRRELAIMLFRDEKCTLARASRLAGLSPIEFQHLLADREIPIHYGADEFRQDLDNLHTAGLL